MKHVLASTIFRVCAEQSTKLNIYRTQLKTQILWDTVCMCKVLPENKVSNYLKKIMSAKTLFPDDGHRTIFLVRLPFGYQIQSVNDSS